MDKVTLEARGYGHAAFVLAVVAFHLWFALDAWRASSSLENLMLVVPLTAVALALSAFILAGILRSAADPPDEDGITWVEPELVAEIGFTEWTDAGRLRHPRYLGLRRDKDPRDVVREDPS